MKSGRAYLALMAAEGMGRAMAFIVGAAIAREYGLEILAIVTLAQSLSAYVSVTSDGGLNNHALMRLFKLSRTRYVVAETSRAQLLIVLGVSPVVALVVYLTADYAVPLFVLFCLVPVATAFSSPYVLQYRGQLMPIALSRLLGAVATALVGVFLIYVAHVPPLYLAVPYIANAVVMMLTVCIRSRIDWRWYLIAVPWARIRNSLVVVRSLGSSALLKQVLLSLPLLLTGNFGAPNEFESMGVVYRLWVVLSLPAAMLATVLIPQIARNPQNNAASQRALSWLLCFSVPVAVVVSIRPDLILSILFGENAAQYGDDLRIFTWALVPLAISSVFSCRFIVRKRYMELMFGNGIGIVALCGSYSLLEMLSGSHAISFAWVISQMAISAYLAVVEFLPRKKVML